MPLAETLAAVDEEEPHPKVRDFYHALVERITDE